jgi:hypothetical protein
MALLRWIPTPIIVGHHPHLVQPIEVYKVIFIPSPISFTTGRLSGLKKKDTILNAAAYKAEKSMKFVSCPAASTKSAGAVEAGRSVGIAEPYPKFQRRSEPASG